jgi:hypothetical protein
MGCTVVQETKPEGGCEILLDLRCMVSGQKLTVRRHVKWAADGKTGSGTINLDQEGGGASCTGAYSVQYRKT